MTDFWLDNPDVLLKDYLSFVPCKNQSKIERLNSVARFCIYNIIIARLFNKNNTILFYFLSSILFSTYFMHKKLKNSEEFKVKDRCYEPTPENPFMNILVNEFSENVDRPPACHVDDENVKDKINEYYNSKLFRDVADIYNTRQAFDRPYTQPSTTIPNDRETFTEYLFHDVIHGNTNCKVASTQCKLRER